MKTVRGCCRPSSPARSAWNWRCRRWRNARPRWKPSPPAGPRNIGRALGLLGSAKPSKSAADAKKLREELIYGERYACLRVLAGYDKDRDGLGQTLSLLREGFAQAAVGREADERLCNRVTVMQLVGAADAVERALLRAGRNVSIPLLSACMVEEVKAALAG